MAPITPLDGEDVMSGEEGSPSTATGEQPTETPGYTSPTEQLLNSLPFGIFRTLAERMGNKGGGGGGSFEFSIDEMRELHRQFTEEADAFERMQEKARQQASSLKPLAGDPASKMHHDAAIKHFDHGLRPAITQQAKFARGFEAAVGKALGVRIATEEAGAEDANKIMRGQ